VCLCRALLLLSTVVTPARAGSDARAVAPDPAALRRPPTLAPFDVKKLPHAEHLATPPVRTLVGYTRRVLRLPDGHTLAVFSYSGSAAAANWLFLIDARDLSSRRIAIPNNDIASHAAALGSDGDIYVMPYHHARAYRFDVAKSTFAPIEVTGLPANEFTWDAIGGEHDGCIYFGTYPNACLGRYEIATGKTTVWPHVAPRATYVMDFHPDPRGGVTFKAWGQDEVWMHLDATSAAPTRIDRPGASATTPTTTVAAATTQPAIVGIGTEPHWTLRAAGGELTIGHYGSLVRRDLTTGATTRGRIDNLAPGGNAIMFLAAVTPDCVVGANYSQQHLFRLNPTTGEVVVSEDMIARTTGEPTCAVALNGKAYVGVYIHSILVEYDPTKPFTFQRNPREVGELFDEHHQTRPSDAVTDGRLVYVSSEGDYGRLGGALGVYDPALGKFDGYGGLAPDENLESMAYDAKDKLLWIGTDRWGQQHSVSPTQPSAVLIAFDPATRTVVKTLTPWPSADTVEVAGCTNDGAIVATSGGRVAVVNGASREVIFNGTWPVVPGKIRRGADGQLYLLSGGTLLRWDVATNTLTAIAQAPPSCVFFTQPSPGRWLFADLTTVYRAQVPSK
jgi:hypothetical protein